MICFSSFFGREAKIELNYNVNLLRGVFLSIFSRAKHIAFGMKNAWPILSFGGFLNFFAPKNGLY